LPNADRLTKAADRQTKAADNRTGTTEANRLMRSTRYLTALGVEQPPSKRESVAIMHERVTGLRDNSSIYLAGVDRTHGIALDELFGKKVVD